MASSCTYANKGCLGRRRGWLALVAILTLAGFFVSASSTDAQTVFNNPTGGPNCRNATGCGPVDDCREFANDCGKPAADFFCQQQGFDSATNFHVTHTHRTVILGTGQICDEPNWCDMLDTVTCKPKLGSCGDCIDGCTGLCEGLTSNEHRDCLRNCVKTCHPPACTP